MGKHPSFKELSELIVQAIIDEPFFNKEKLTPKIYAIIKGFNLKISRIPNLEKEETENEKHKRLLHIQKKEDQIVFWKRKCQEYLPDKMNDFYKEVDKI